MQRYGIGLRFLATAWRQEPQSGQVGACVTPSLLLEPTLRCLVIGKHAEHLLKRQCLSVGSSWVALCFVHFSLVKWSWTASNMVIKTRKSRILQKKFAFVCGISYFCVSNAHSGVRIRHKNTQ